MDEYCQGFIFQYFVPDNEGDPVRARRDKTFLQAEDKVLQRTREILVQRYDLLETISCFDPPLEVHLYRGQTFRDIEDQHYFYGRVTFDGDTRVMELAVEEVLKTFGGFGEVMDIVAHELMHVLDYLDDIPGFLPGWSHKQREAFKAARSLERKAIMKGESPLHRYALVSQEEFLAVLGEVYFTQPKVLEAANPLLFQLMNQYFLPNG